MEDTISKHIKCFIKDENIETHITSLARCGERHTSYICKVVVYYNNECSDEKYIVKICKENCYNIIKDISIKCENLKISPALLYYDDMDRVLIYEYIEPYSTKKVNIDIRLKDIVKKLKIYHSLEIENTVVNNFSLNNTEFPEDSIYDHYRLTIKIANILEDKISKYGTITSHNDLHLLNMLFSNNGYYIIDYETTFKNNPLLDLSYLTLNFINKDEELLKEYFNIETVPEELKLDFTIAKAYSILHQSIFYYYFVETYGGGLDESLLTHNVKEIKKVSDIPFSELFILSIYNRNDCYLLTTAILKEGLNIVLNNKNIFTELLGDDLINEIESIC
jgi:thiamine kinase-like enzyme